MKNTTETAIPTWITGTDLDQYPTPAELCAIAVALKANLANEIVTQPVATNIDLRETPQLSSGLSFCREEL